MEELEPTPITEIVQSLIGDRGEGRKSKDDEKAGRHVKRCRHVFIDKSSRGPLPFWRIVKRGSYGGVRVLHASPSPCILTPSTRITYTEACRYEFREIENNVVITEDCGTGRSHLYAYPKKVWHELYDYYIKPLTEGREPYNVGVILMGPPGTGKSRLAKIIAKYAGVNIYTVDTGILSKWVGESENKLRDLIKQARESQPSIIILDDAEWLLIARALASAESGGMAEVRLNLQQILFSAMQEIYDRREHVLFVATTNVKQEILDPALIRHGRFGPPIFVPLPDLEAAKIIVREVLPDRSEEEIEKIAFTAVNAGLSAADTIALAEKVKRGGEPKPRTVGGRGYARIFVDRVEEFDRLEREYRIPFSVLLSSPRSRLSIYGPEELATAFAVQIAYSSRKTVIKLTDVRYLDEAIHSANMLGSVFIAPTRLPPEVQYYIHDNLDTPLILVGEHPPAIPTFPLGDVPYLIKRVGVEASVKAATALRGSRAPPALVKMIVNKAAGDYQLAAKLLNTIMTTGIIDTEHLQGIISWTV